MIDRDTAKNLVLRFLSTLPEKNGSEWAVEDDKTEEFDVGWLFCWTLRKFIGRAGHRPGMVGNNPILVDKTDGSLYSWSLLEPFDQVLEKFRNDKGSLPRLEIEDG